MLKIYYRTYQGVLKIASYFVPWRKPQLIKGMNSLRKLSNILKENNLEKVLVVTDEGISSLGLMNPMFEDFEKNKIQYVVYNKTVMNPTIDNIEEALTVYKTNNCEAIVAFGGGSSIDCGKAIGARVARPNKSIREMRGLLKVRKNLPTLIAIPTTAGTGSEATVAAVITDSITHEKYAINDMAIIPHYAVLDPVLTEKLPQRITSTTGMDALVHAVEVYIGKGNTKETKELSRNALLLISENLYEVYLNGENLEARENMQMAAYYAGVAFTRAYVGYVHAIAHTLGGTYSVPHGLANAVILPYVLEAYGKSVYHSLAELADLIKITNEEDTKEQKAKKFIEYLRDLNQKMEIPNKIEGIQEKDIDMMVDRALKEANPLYPVPRILSKKEIKALYYKIKVEEGK